MTVANQPNPPITPVPMRPPAKRVVPAAASDTAAGLGDVQRLLLQHVGWDDYVAIGEALRDRAGLRLTYDRGALELMTLSHEHEAFKCVLGRLVEAMSEEFGLAIRAFGSATYFSKVAERGLEPDQCYYFRNLDRVRGIRRFDPAVHPPPDLAVEIEVTRTAVDRLGIYAALGIGELWRFDGETLTFHLLREGTYHQVDRSPTFPSVPAPDVVGFVRRCDETDDNTAIREFRLWLRGLPRRAAP